MSAFPEGGELISEVVAIVGIKLDQAGKGIEGEIEIVQNGEGINDFETNEFGFGKFVLRPESGSTYSLKYNGMTYPVPEIRSSGVNMSARTTEDLFTLHINEQGVPEIKDYCIISH